MKNKEEESFDEMLDLEEYYKMEDSKPATQERTLEVIPDKED